MKYISIILLLISCSKQHDYGYLNTDRRPQVLLVSKRFTNPPEINKDGTWKPYAVKTIAYDRDIWYGSYINIPADTIYSTCSIDKIDSNFKIEIRKFVIQCY